MNKKIITAGIVGTLALGGSLYFGGDVNDLTASSVAEKYEQATEIKAKYELKGATLERTDIKNAELTKKGEYKDIVRVTIGDKPVEGQLEGQLGGESEFSPNVTISRWDEVSFKLKTGNLLKDAKNKTLNFEGDKIKYSTDKMDFEMYDYEDGYKYIWYLNEKPLTNKIEFEIESEGLDFFYQPPLTQEEIDDGAFRPENVVGSYAVYAKEQKTNWTGGKEYKVGKVGHIYRPRIEDTKGTKVWGDLHIENGILSVTIPQEFINTAQYPIRHAAGLTFGYEGTGGSFTQISGDRLIGGLYSSVAGNTVDKISQYTRHSASGSVKGLITNSSKNIISNGVSSGTALTSTATWYDFVFSTPPDVSDATDYYLCGVTSASWYYYYFDVGETGGTHIYDTSNSYSSPTNPTDATSGTRKIFIYATYTAGGDEAAPIYESVWDDN